MDYKNFEIKINTILTQNQFLESYFKYNFSKKLISSWGNIIKIIVGILIMN